MLEAPLQLSCFEYRKILQGGVTEPLLMAAKNNIGEEYVVVLKLRNPASTNGHFQGTSLACELICSVIARTIGLPVPDYAVVEVPELLVSCIENAQIRQVVSKNVGFNFGTVYKPEFGLWRPDYRQTSLELLKKLEKVICFDAIVINGDRKKSKPNLLWKGEEILLIDHSLALPVHNVNKQIVPGNFLFPKEHIEQHCTYHALHKTKVNFSNLMDIWQNAIRKIQLEELRSFIPSTWEKTTGDLDRIFNFLESRPSHFDEISNHIRSIMQ